MDTQPIVPLLSKALAARSALFDPRHESAFRLFNGFTEGLPGFVVDLYGSTLVIHNHAQVPNPGEDNVQEVFGFLSNHPNLSGWLKAVVLKERNSPDPQARRGRLLLGTKPDHRVRENGVWYALDLLMHQDASLYLDTRILRQWLLSNSTGRRILNTFSYTGSLGVASMAGGASRVIHIDRNRSSLNLAKTSYSMNGFAIDKSDFMSADFFDAIARFKRAGDLFDTAIIDPPFFSETSKGRVDLLHESTRLINKVRPLIRDGGILIAINNALYLSGEAYMQALQMLFADGYLRLGEIIPIPEDFTGYPETRLGTPITDPAPFNHSTKIALLHVTRKNQVH